MLQTVLPAFGINEKTSQIIPFGSGLINNTWKVVTPGGDFILQRLNTNVFKKPLEIAENISLIASYLAGHFPEYKFVAPIAAINGDAMAHVAGEGYFRLFPFVPASHTIDVVETPAQAYEAAKQFGRFTMLLKDFDTGKLNMTIPAFHDLSLRYQQFLTSLKSGNQQRIEAAKDLVEASLQHADIVAEYEAITSDAGFRQRVTHHDTKISNVLFNDADKGICVIDLDTLMPGYFISDVGDMMRTYLCPVSEEETDLSRIEIRTDFYRAIVNGYFSEMNGVLTKKEQGYFFYAGKFMIYMQALRFITDHFNNDEYYGAKYPGHNLNRAANQLLLLQKLLEKEDVLIDCLS